MESTKNANGTWTRLFAIGDRVHVTVFDEPMFGTIIADRETTKLPTYLNYGKRDFVVQWDFGTACWEDTADLDRA